MFKQKRFLLSIILIGLQLCCSAADPDSVKSSGEDVVLKFDSGNVSSPLLPADTWEAAVRFPVTTTLDVTRGELTEIHYYVNDTPETCILKIYSQASVSQPGGLIYSANVLPEVTSPRWNTHYLSTPVRITGRDIWVSLQFRQNREMRTIGIDGGAGKLDGGRLYRKSDNSWSTLQAVSKLNANWNIRALVIVE